jgi:hypothetical protein
MFIAAAMYDKVLPITLAVPAPLTVTAWLFEWWFLWMLLLSLPMGTIVMLDNARVHRPEILRNMCKMFGMGLVYLPPYSPGIHLQLPAHHIAQGRAGQQERPNHGSD